MKIPTYLLLALIIISCSKPSSIIEPQFAEEIHWLLGADHGGDTSVVIAAPGSSVSELIVTTYSLCPNLHASFVIMDSTNKSILETTVDTLMNQNIEIPTDGPLQIMATLQPVENGIVCVWMGEVEMVFRYFK